MYETLAAIVTTFTAIRPTKPAQNDVVPLLLVHEEASRRELPEGAVAFEFDDVEVKDEPPCAAAVADWLLNQDIDRIEKFDDVVELFNEFSLLFGFQYVSAWKTGKIVSGSERWQKIRVGRRNASHYLIRPPKKSQQVA